MTKDELKALGLTDEQVDAVFAAHGKTLNATKAELAEVTASRDSLQTQLEQQAAAVKELTEKQAENSTAKESLEKLTADFESYKTKAAQELATTKKANAIALAVRDTGTVDPEVLTSLINADSVVIGEDGKANLDDIVKGLRESKPYLFQATAQEDKTSPRFTATGNPSGSAEGEVDPFQAVVNSYK